MEDRARCCQDCKAPCAGDFQKVLDLKYSGLVIYLHTKKDEEKRPDASEDDDTYILHNTGSKEINKTECISELRRYKPKCVQCKTIVQRVRSLLDEIKALKEDEIIGVCDHCKRANINRTCKRCDFIVSKFISLHRKKCEEKQERFKIWLCKVKHLLHAILQGENVCQHRVYKDAELERFLHQLKVPLSIREPDINFFPTLDTEQLSSLKSLSESKEMLEELLSKIKFQGQLSSDNSLYPSPSKETCLCKLLKERQLEQSSGFGTEKSIVTKDTELPSKQSKDFSKLLSDEVYRELIKRLLKLSKALPKGMHLNKELILQLIQTLNIAINQGLTTDIIVKLIDELGELNKTLSPYFSDDLNKEVVQGLINDLNELLTLGSSKALSHDLIQLLIDLSELLTNELTKSMSQKQSKLFSRSVHKDLARVLSKSTHKDISEKLSRMLLTQKTARSPKSRSVEKKKEIPKTIITEKGSPKDKTQGLPKDKTQGLPKDKTQGLPKDKKQGSLKDETKDLEQGSERNRSKEMRNMSPKSQSKDRTQGITKDMIKDNKQILPRKDKGKSQQLLKDNISKAQKDMKPVSSTIKSKEVTQKSSKDLNNELAQKLEALKKALGQSGINKNIIEDMTTDINKALTQKSPDLTKKLLQDLTDLCKPAVQGIPNTANMKLVQNLLKDANAAVAKGISDDPNKKSVQGVLSDLKRAINQSKKEEHPPSKGLKKEISKELSSGLSSKAQAAGLRESRKKHYKGIDDPGASHDGDISGDKTETKSRKNVSRKVKLDEKENELSADEKKKKGSKSKIMLQSTAGKTPLTPKQLSESVLLKLLKENKERAARQKISLERQEAKKREMEKQRIKERTFKKLKQPKKQVPPPTPEVMSESLILECNIDQARVPKLRVAGNKIAPYKPYLNEEENQSVEPLIFKTTLEFSGDPMAELQEQKRKSIDDYKEKMFRDGTIRYRLSDQEFINKGWTKLPTKKIMRRMNIYKMEPAKPNNDWFERHKKEGELFYDSGEKLADIDEDGRGHWYYQNGAVALDYYNAQEINIGQRYVVYSSGEEMDHGKLKPRTVLALFDVLGNGVVYDHYGNVRLKYNQSEGLLVDPKLGPPGKWKWHTLNDPPVLQQVFVNTRLKERDIQLEMVGKHDKTEDSGGPIKKAHPEMLAIEFENFVKEKATKLLQKFKPFQIRMKAIKLNDQFSLKILDQANIYLLFRQGTTTLKLNLGLLLISNEIIDTDTSEIADVATPYDRHPAKTVSVENIQKMLKTVKSGKLSPPPEMNVKVSI